MEIAAEKANTDVISEVFDRQRKRSLLLRYEPLSARKYRLQALHDWILANRERIEKAVHADFRKPFLEADISEIYPALAEARHAIKHLGEWARPSLVDAPLAYLGTRSEIRYEPKGVCLIIAPWNYPFNLCVGPLISALAAGNTAMLKPSELTPSTSALIRDMISELFSDDLVAVVEGGPDVSTRLLSLPFDHIFFTGSPAVGKIVMKAAAENLASVTLELGGKTPTVVDESAAIRDAAKRIAFGKFLNNGQTCIAPDYILIEESVKASFIAELKRNILLLFADATDLDESSPHYARIVNRRHVGRLNALLQDALQRGATLELGGPVNEETRFIHPMILSNVPMESRIMEEEIFGPLLPVVSYRTLQDAINIINGKPKPLALYIFSSRRAVRESILSQTSAGGVCINDCLMHFTHPNLPFGGVNNSGIGKSHGHHGFRAFSNEKPVLKQKNGFASPYLTYPPYTPGKKKIIDFLLRWF